MANVWGSMPIKIIRFILFIPIGFILLSILQMIPLAVFDWLALKTFTSTWFSVLIALFLISIAAGVAWFYGLVVYFAPILACRVIAPWHKVSAVIFGTLFLAAEIVSMVLWCRAGNSAWFLIYYIIFTLVVISGLFGSCERDE